MHDSANDFIIAEYLAAKQLWSGKKFKYIKKRGGEQKKTGSLPFTDGRDPKIAKNVLSDMVQEMGWAQEIAQAQIINEWAIFVGAKTAEHSKVLGIRNHVLEVQCDATSWATELRRLRSEILTRLNVEYPAAKITELKFLAPGAPTWRHGPRVIRGRGPRDTYG